MFAYIHPACGQPAFLAPKRIMPGDPALTENLLKLDHTPMEYGMAPRCGACGNSIGKPSALNFRQMV